MNAITQSELDNLILAARSPNGPASIEWFWSQREALIAAAEEGMKTSQMVFEIHHVTGSEDTRNEVDKVRSVVQERDALRARVQELEEMLCRCVDEISIIETIYPVDDKRCDTLNDARAALSNSTPQPPRYTLEEVTYAYTVGYQNGHELTVESSFLPIVFGEYTTFWKDNVEELMNELRGTPAPQQKEGE